MQALSEVQENTLRSMEEQNAALRAQNEALRDLCTSMADGFRENSNLYRSMLEQNRAISQDAYTSVLGEVRQVHAALKETQTQLRAVAGDLAELKSMRAAAAATPPKMPEVAEVKASEEVPVDIPAGGWHVVLCLVLFLMLCCAYLVIFFSSLSSSFIVPLSSFWS